MIVEEEEDLKNKLFFWKDGNYNTRWGTFVRNGLKVVMNRIIENGGNPVGIVVDMNSFNLEILIEDDGKYFDEGGGEEWEDKNCFMYLYRWKLLVLFYKENCIFNCLKKGINYTAGGYKWKYKNG